MIQYTLFLMAVLTNLVVVVIFFVKMSTKIDMLYNGLKNSKGQLDVHKKEKINTKFEIRDNRIKEVSVEVNELSICIRDIKSDIGWIKREMEA